MLVLNYENLKNETIKSIKRFSEFMGISGQDDIVYEDDYYMPESIYESLTQLSLSTGIIITKLDRNDFNENIDENKIKSELISRLLDILNEASQSNMIIRKEKALFNMILLKNNIGIFYNPKENIKTVPKSKLSLFLKFLDFEYKDMKFRIENHSNEFTNYIYNYYEKYTQTFELEIENIIRKYNISEISNKLISIYTVNNATSLLQGIYDTGKEKLDFESCQNNIFKLLTDHLVDKTEMDFLNTKKKIFDFFILFLTKDFRDDIFREEQSQCINSNILSDINNKLVEIIQFRDYFETTYNPIDGSLLYKAHFHNLSNIVFQINDDDNLVNISSVKIFATHSILLDSDYKLNTFKAKEETRENMLQLSNSIYNGHAPDLILISPNFLLTKSITIDLSCLTTQKYPYDNEKANNGALPGEDGADGEPGLHGFDGGRLIILTENSLNTAYLNFISLGGKGGPGQNGKN